jgi:hypothetical protein
VDNATDLGPDFAAGFAADDMPDGGMKAAQTQYPKQMKLSKMW